MTTDRALQMAAEALADHRIAKSPVGARSGAALRPFLIDEVRPEVEVVYDAILDALLSELPEHADETAQTMVGPGDGPATLEMRQDECRRVLSAFLLSLRSSSRGANG